MRPGLILATLLLAAPAHADFKVCNHAGNAARVALGRYDGTAWLSEGWWTVAPRACTAVLTGKLVARYYYVYASDGGAGIWGGSRAFCVGNAKFQIIGRGNCAGRGYDKKSFFEVDTGNAPDWTQSLSD
jgi:uncharacterized membrane protein